jgi:hypothetical protein
MNFASADTRQEGQPHEKYHIDAQGKRMFLKIILRVKGRIRENSLTIINPTVAGKKVQRRNVSIIIPIWENVCGSDFIPVFHERFRYIAKPAAGSHTGSGSSNPSLWITLKNLSISFGSVV